MRAVVQRVSQASVRVAGETIGEIRHGLMILLGVGTADDEASVEPFAAKIAKLRIFEDEAGKMNLDVRDVGGSALVVSQFTLYADTRSGNRPGFQLAARPEQAEGLYEAFCSALAGCGVPVATGSFGADMKVALTNDGPVTIVLDDAREGR